MIVQHGPTCLHINQLDLIMHRSSPISTHLFLLSYHCLHIILSSTVIPVLVPYNSTVQLSNTYNTIATRYRYSPARPSRTTTPHRDVRISFNNCGLGRGQIHFATVPDPSTDTSGYFERQRSNNLHNVYGRLPAVRICLCARWTFPSL